MVKMVRWPTGEADDKQQFEKPCRDAMLCERYHPEWTDTALPPISGTTLKDTSKEKSPQQNLLCPKPEQRNPAGNPQAHIFEFLASREWHYLGDSPTYQQAMALT
ncbi:hypothetical protein STEG23_005015 [Scotinomys teguina]